MPVIICWFEQKTKKECCFKLSTPVGILNVYQVDSMVVKTEWNLESTEALTDVSEQCKSILHYLNNPATDLNLNLLKQGSDFRNKVWGEISKISPGQVLSYSELARQIDSGARAVANACRDNPFPGIIPCHRVISVSGLGGYMGQTTGRALEIKKQLLAIESVVII